VTPVESVSVAINMRLYRAVFTVKGKNLLASAAATHLTDRILGQPYVPLAMDVDGPLAASKGVDPFYIAPPILDSDDPYQSGRYWSVGQRHGGKAIVGFIGGHVLGSSRPADERWDWAHQGEVGR
jgi:prepilin-type processing-associated H-X9-DG protein